MTYGYVPLYPPMEGGCARPSCVRMPLFGGDGGGMETSVREIRRVTVENPCRPGECAEVVLGLDAFGCLTVCVHREPPRRGCPCRDRHPLPPPEPREDDWRRCGR